MITLEATNGGIVSGHIQAIHAVCKRANTFLFIRPSEQASMRLIAEGFATKSMDIHDKSSNWGLTSGFVPVDQAFNKKQAGAPNPNISPHAHGDAKVTQLAYDGAKFTKLLSQGHFEPMVAAGAGDPCLSAEEGRLEDPQAQIAHYHSPKRPEVCLLYRKSDGKVFWRFKAARRRLRLGPELKNPDVPMWVWAYDVAGSLTPVTGDYDMWMVAPHITAMMGQRGRSGPDTVRAVRAARAIASVRDSHGRSAATAFTSALIPALNAGCSRSSNPVFRHGAEAQNFSFTQALDRKLALFGPGSMTPKLITWNILPGVLHDLQRHGYVVTRNPKWMGDSTLGVEDMAFAPGEFAEDGAVKAGRAAQRKLEAGAVGAVLKHAKEGSLAARMFSTSPEIREAIKAGNAPTKPGGPGAWDERRDELRRFRTASNVPAQQGSDLVLPPTAFHPEAVEFNKALAEAATTLAHDQEARFGRQEFIREADGHVSPVDATR